MAEDTKKIEEQGSAGQGAIMGRPSLFTQELADKICEELAMGYSLRTVCKADEMPSVATVFNWFRTHEDFLEQYTRAKQEAADAMAEDILDIADDASNDWMIRHGKDEDEAYQLNGEHLQRSRLRIDTRKFLMAKMKPKRYGEKLDLTTGGDKLNRNTSDAELDAILSRAGAATDQAGQNPKA
jgi:hypothetical protein